MIRLIESVSDLRALLDCDPAAFVRIGSADVAVSSIVSHQVLDGVDAFTTQAGELLVSKPTDTVCLGTDLAQALTFYRGREVPPGDYRIEFAVYNTGGLDYLRYTNIFFEEPVTGFVSGPDVWGDFADNTKPGDDPFRNGNPFASQELNGERKNGYDDGDIRSAKYLGVSDLRAGFRLRLNANKQGNGTSATFYHHRWRLLNGVRVLQEIEKTGQIQGTTFQEIVTFEAF